MTLIEQQPLLRAKFFEALERGSHAFFSSCDWALVVGDLRESTGTDVQREYFATQWVTHGRSIRDQIRDDHFLVCTLRRWLPAYEGSGLILYRGESAERATSKQYGLCWTTDIEVATTFASGLNAVRPAGGLLLKAYASRDAVITAPGRHSKYLGESEYTVDPANLTDIEVLAQFPPSDRRPAET